ncbi:nucleotidyltransferase domain-containing protein [Actinomyces ruminicola]|uniref:nucleotidyltransferase domain-containing protein n=1 Tax=Actinomyces ruminicola TaxID=332524 RepID=UPI000B8A4F85
MPPTLRLFGSVARGDAGQQSAIDILVDLESAHVRQPEHSQIHFPPLVLSIIWPPARAAASNPRVTDR